MDRLVSYDPASLIAELQRVAGLVPGRELSRAAYDNLARASSDTQCRRFGGWRGALEAAGLGERYVGPAVSDKMRSQASKAMSREDIVVELRRIAHDKGDTTLTRSDLKTYEASMGERVIANRFGSWSAALEAAGLTLSAMGRRWSDVDYFENLLEIWTHYGRAPRYSEMNRPPSRIPNGAYAARFGTWGKAKLAFVERANEDTASAETEPTPAPSVQPRQPQATYGLEDQRTILVGLRYQVLRRDRFRCVTCGRSPATDPGVTLHVDHIVPFSGGGKTRLDNLRALCRDCNLGKGRGEA